MSLANLTIVLHGMACVACLLFAYSLRATPERSQAYTLALVWCAWFVVDRGRGLILDALPPPGPDPVTGFGNRVLLAIDSAAYLAWPFGFLAWIRWAFARVNPWLVLLAWIAAAALPIATYPAIRGAAWFRYTGTLHLATLVAEAFTIAKWAGTREAPRAWHAIAMVAAPVSAIPVLPFFAAAEARAGYVVWVIRGLVLLHLWCIAVLGGELWNRSSRGSSRQS